MFEEIAEEALKYSPSFDTDHYQEDREIFLTHSMSERKVGEEFNESYFQNHTLIDEMDKYNLNSEFNKQENQEDVEIHIKKDESQETLTTIWHSIFSVLPFIIDTFEDSRDVFTVRTLLWRICKTTWSSTKKIFAGNTPLNISENNLEHVDTSILCLPCDRSFPKRDEIYRCIRQPLDQQKVSQKPSLKTLEESLTFFDLSSQLLKLEESLEAVRKGEISRKTHEDFFKKFDKEIQKLSIQHHPDKVKNRGGTDSEIRTAQNLQTAVNALRTALNFLNFVFIEDIGTDHQFSFYTDLNISSVCNEDEMKKRISEVIYKINMITRIKQRYIIPEVRKFLIESKKCICSYLAEEFDDFNASRNAALLHLDNCIKGFEKLYIKIQEVSEQCRSEENGTNMLSALQHMASKSKTNLNQLQLLNEAAKSSLEGKYKFCSPENAMDSYFVLPFVYYTNIILMCNVMVNNVSVLGKMKRRFYTEPHPKFSKELSDLMQLYYLASYCSGNKCHEITVFNIMNNEQPAPKGLEYHISKKEIKLEFGKRLKHISQRIESKFLVDDYPETSTSDRDLEKCLKLMTEFQEKEKEVSKQFEELEKKNEKLNEEYEKFVKRMKENEELDQKVEEILERNRKFNEMVNDILSERL